MIDLRSIPESGQAGGTPQGYGWFTYDKPVSICSLSCHHEGLLIAQGLDEPATNRGAIASRLRLPLKATTPRALIAEILTQNGDPTGQNAHKPLLSDSIHIAGREIWKSPYKWHQAGANPVWHDLALRVRQEDYRRIRDESLKRGSQQYKRVLDFWHEQYDLAAEVFVPPGLPFEGVLPHETTIGDTFVEASDTALGSHTATGANGGFSWSVITGSFTVQAASDDLISGASSNQRARAESDLSSDDMDAEVDVTTASSLRNLGVAVRYNSAADSAYLYLTRASTSNTNRLFKLTNGAFSQIGSTVNEGSAPTTPYNIRLQVDGNNLEGFRDDVSKITGMDPNFTGQTRAGILMDEANQVIDNFEASDLAAPPAAALPGSRAWYVN